MVDDIEWLDPTGPTPGPGHAGDPADRTPTEAAAVSRHRPRWLVPVGTGLVGLLVGAIGATAVHDRTCEVDGDDREGEVAIYLSPDTTEAEVDQMRVLLDADERLEQVVFVDQEASLAEFQELFAHDDELLVERMTADQLPASFRLHLHDTADEGIAEVEEAYDDHPFVYDVVTDLDSRSFERQRRAAICGGD